MPFLKSINLKYLPRVLQFKLCNACLSFILSHDLNNSLNSICSQKFLLDNMLYALKNLNAQTFCFLKKILPFIKDKNIYDNLLDFILFSKDKIKNFDYEYYLSETLGVRLIGDKLYISPNKRGKEEVCLWLRQHKINLSKFCGWQKISLDGLNLYGIDCFNLDNLSPEINLKFY